MNYCLILAPVTASITLKGDAVVIFRRNLQKQKRKRHWQIQWSWQLLIYESTEAVLLLGYTHSTHKSFSTSDLFLDTFQLLLMILFWVLFPKRPCGSLFGTLRWLKWPLSPGNLKQILQLAQCFPYTGNSWINGCWNGFPWKPLIHENWCSASGVRFGSWGASSAGDGLHRTPTLSITCDFSRIAGIYKIQH